MKTDYIYLRVPVRGGVPVGAPEPVEHQCLKCSRVNKCAMASQLQDYDADENLEALVVSCGSFQPRVETA